MSLRGLLPLVRRATYFVFPAVLAVSVSGTLAVTAQAQFLDSHDSIASSAQGVIADDAMPAGVPAASGSGAAGQSGGYGYHDHNWMSHLTGEAGAGFNAPVGNDKPFITWGGNFTVGGGYKFSNRIHVMAEYQFIDDKLPGSLIADAGAQGGHAHIWSLTLDPVIYLFPKHKNDVYVTGGGGFYRKVTSFTDPEEVIDCEIFCEEGTENVVVSHFSSNQGGANLGVGFTHKLGEGDNMRAFAEVRYLWIDTPQVGTNDGLGRTGLLPVTIGVRF
jgi:Outer membrane protein beta-barrel domain